MGIYRTLSLPQHSFPNLVGKATTLVWGGGGLPPALGGALEELPGKLPAHPHLVWPRPRHGHQAASQDKGCREGGSGDPRQPEMRFLETPGSGALCRHITKSLPPEAEEPAPSRGALAHHLPFGYTPLRFSWLRGKQGFLTFPPTQSSLRGVGNDKH
uniref:Uncharacterized protein n=1 Tax=Myotis myotis TaxID=51298 RepID=A0A7J7UP95_MYOMY|nr:hypothetical protein mMyoMyo1_008550 [Myotis myotis]